MIRLKLIRSKRHTFCYNDFDLFTIRHRIYARRIIVGKFWQIMCSANSVEHWRYYDSCPRDVTVQRYQLFCLARLVRSSIVNPRRPYCFRSICHACRQRVVLVCPTQPCYCCSTLIGLPCWQPYLAKTCRSSCPTTLVDQSASPAGLLPALPLHRMLAGCRQTLNCGGSSTAERHRRRTFRRPGRQPTTQD